MFSILFFILIYYLLFAFHLKIILKLSILFFLLRGILICFDWFVSFISVYVWVSQLWRLKTNK